MFSASLCQTVPYMPNADAEGAADMLVQTGKE